MTLLPHRAARRRRRRSRLSLRTRVVALVAGAVLPALLAAMGFLAVAANSILRAHASRELELRTRGVAASVEHWDNYMVLALESLRKLPGIASMDPARQRPALVQMAEVYKDLIMLGVAGPDGVSTARSDSRPLLDYHARQWFQGAMAGRPVTRQTLLSLSTGTSAVAYAAPVRDPAGRIVGAAFCTMDERQIATQVGIGRFGRTGYCFVVDDHGVAVAHPDSAVRRLTDLHELAPVAAVLRARADAHGVFADEHGVRWLYRAMPLPNGWAVVGAEQEDEALADGRRYFRMVLSVALVAVTLALAAAWIGASRLLDPIRRLTDAALALSAGEWTVPVPAAAAGELGALAAAFEQMRRDLQDAYHTVEERVVARTAELTAANRELSESRVERERTLARLSAAEEEFRLTFELAGVGMTQADPETCRLTRVNRRMCQMTGYDEAELLAMTFLDITHPDDRASNHGSHVRITTGDADTYAMEKRYIRKDGSVMWVHLTATVIRGDDGRPLRTIAVVQDIDARRRAELTLARMAYHDSLTGLPNRAMFLERVGGCLSRGEGFAVLYLDLDRFKLVNDSLGHAAGDRLLSEVAARLEACIASVATGGSLVNMVARLGGDEFTVLLQDISGPDDAIRVAGHVLATLANPVVFDGQELFTTASVGIVLGNQPDAAAPARWNNALELLRDADAAMYRAKSLGKGQFSIFDATLHDAAVNRLRLENDLRRAIERGELLLHYQPIVSLETRQLLGFEALVRWRRDGRLISPAQFIPVAEDTGLIRPIGTWVLREACRQLAAWQTRHGAAARDLHMSVNVSRRQLANPDLVPMVRSALADAGLSPACVKLEITESVIVEDGEEARRVLVALKELGVQLSMDDFGTGYSSLSCLHKFPIDVLKVDRTFVANLEGRHDAAAVIHAIVALAHNLKMKVVAEGIEKPEQIAFLQALECDAGQGYLFSRPMDADAAEQWVAAIATPVLAA